MPSWEGSAVCCGRMVALARGAKERDPGMGPARLASSSKGRWDLTFEGGRLVLQESGIRFRGSGCRELCGSLGPCTSVGRERLGSDCLPQG